MWKNFSLVLFLGLMAALPARALMVPAGDMLAGVRPGPDGKIDVLTVFAHEDDESIYGGGTLIKIKKDPRVRLHILCLCRGNWPEQAKDLGIEEDYLVSIRTQELLSAAAVLKADDVTHWNYDDLELAKLDQAKLLADILAVMNQTGAEIVITHDPAGITRNSDHIVCSRQATAAFSQSPAQRLYYPTLPAPIYKVAMYLERQEWQGDVVTPAEPTFDVDIRAERDLKRMACYEHASQISFSDLGTVVNILLKFPKEYWALGGKKD